MLIITDCSCISKVIIYSLTMGRTWRENANQKDVKGLALQRKQITSGRSDELALEQASENKNTSNFLPEFCSYDLYLYNSKYIYFQILVGGKCANYQNFRWK